MNIKLYKLVFHSFQFWITKMSQYSKLNKFNFSFALVIPRSNIYNLPVYLPVDKS